MNAEGTVLIAYDGSPHSKAAIERAGLLLRVRTALVVTVWESIRPAGGIALLGLPGDVAREAIAMLDESNAEEARTCASEGERLAKEAGLEAHSRAVLSRGGIWATILRLAEEEDASIVAMGSRGRSAIRSALLGSVSHGVVQRCPRPVMVVSAPLETDGETQAIPG